MKTSNYHLVRYEADEGMVFDWATPRVDKDEKGVEHEGHLYAKVLFIGATDKIENYIEVPAPAQKE